MLEACAKYFFELDGGKKIRPTMVLLVAEATGYHQRLMDLRGTKAAHHGASPHCAHPHTACYSYSHSCCLVQARQQQGWAVRACCCRRSGWRRSRR